MPTMVDVAKRAGVSPITVSRVISNSGPVSDETRHRVLEAVDALGYVPNRLARIFRLKKTSTLALVLSDIINPFWTTVTRGAEDAARERGYHLILCNTDDSSDMQNEYISMLLQKQVEGILLVPSASNPDPINFIQSQGVPVVIIDRRRVPGAEVDIVRGDSEGGAFQLVELLLNLGHRRIAVLTGPAHVSTAVDRVTGYRRALRDAGLDDSAEMVYHGEFSLDSGYEMARRVLARNPRPTALFAGNNFIMIGAMRALRDAGLRIPDDMALVAFDGVPEHLVVDHVLTVAAQPGYEIGKRAAELLIARLESPETADYQEIVLPTQLIVSASSGGPLNQKG